MYSTLTMRVYANSRMTRIILTPLKIETEMNFLDALGASITFSMLDAGPDEEGEIVLHVRLELKLPF